MTAIEKTEAIRDLAAANLPALLATASLDNFDFYRNVPPLEVDKKEWCVYIEGEDDDVNATMFSVMIQGQLPKDNRQDEYHSVIMPFLREQLTGAVVGMTQRTLVRAKVWPIDELDSTSYCFYLVQFETELDDCEDDS